jgi:glutaminase
MQNLAHDTHSFVLDLHQVSGISESAARLLNKARLVFAEMGTAVVCSRVRDTKAVIGPLSKSVRSGDRGFLRFEDNDLAAEWCENRLLCEIPQTSAKVVSLADSRLFQGMPENLLREIERATQSHTFAPGEQILKIGDEGDGRVFFVLSGYVSVLVPLRDGAHQRVTSLGPGMEFGEMALIGQTTRSASVFADSEVTCLVLEAQDIERLSEQNPLFKIRLLENLAREMADRLRGANQWIAALA